MQLTKEQQLLQDRRNDYIQSLVEKCKSQDEIFSTTRLFGIGGSDVAAIMGMSKWRTAYDVWRTKTFRQSVIEEKLCFDTGHALEGVVAKWYEKKTGYTVYEAEHLAMEGYPFLLGNFDRIVFDKPQEQGGQIVCGLECKTANDNTKIIINGAERSKWGKDNVYNDNRELVVESDQIDPEYVAQVQFYMMVSGLPFWDVAVMIGNHELRYYRVRADRDFQQKMLNACVDFWLNHVLTDIAPTMTIADAKTMSVEENTAEADKEIFELVDMRKDINIKINALEADLKAVENKLADKIKDYTKITYKNNEGKTKTLITFKASNRTTFDSKTFESEHPDLYKNYLKTTTTSRVLRFY